MRVTAGEEATLAGFDLGHCCPVRKGTEACIVFEVFRAVVCLDVDDGIAKVNLCREHTQAIAQNLTRSA